MSRLFLKLARALHGYAARAHAAGLDRVVRKAEKRVLSADKTVESVRKLYESVCAYADRCDNDLILVEEAAAAERQQYGIK